MISFGLLLPFISLSTRINLLVATFVVIKVVPVTFSKPRFSRGFQAPRQVFVEPIVLAITMVQRLGAHRQGQCVLDKILPCDAPSHVGYIVIQQHLNHAVRTVVVCLISAGNLLVRFHPDFDEPTTHNDPAESNPCTNPGAMIRCGDAFDFRQWNTQVIVRFHKEQVRRVSTDIQRDLKDSQQLFSVTFLAVGKTGTSITSRNWSCVQV